MISMSHGEIISRAAAFFYVLFSSPMYIEIRAGDGCVRKDLFFFIFGTMNEQYHMHDSKLHVMFITIEQKG